MKRMIAVLSLSAALLFTLTACQSNVGDHANMTPTPVISIELPPVDSDMPGSGVPTATPGNPTASPANSTASPAA